MPADLIGTLHLRTFDPRRGMVEDVREFGTLDELFHPCTSQISPSVVERIILSGSDATGEPRIVTFVFSSVTGRDVPDG